MHSQLRLRKKCSKIPWFLEHQHSKTVLETQSASCSMTFEGFDAGVDFCTIQTSSSVNNIEFPAVCCVGTSLLFLKIYATCETAPCIFHFRCTQLGDDQFIVMNSPQWYARQIWYTSKLDAQPKSCFCIVHVQEEFCMHSWNFLLRLTHRYCEGFGDWWYSQTLIVFPLLFLHLWSLLFSLSNGIVCLTKNVRWLENIFECCLYKTLFTAVLIHDSYITSIRKAMRIVVMHCMRWETAWAILRSIMISQFINQRTLVGRVITYTFLTRMMRHGLLVWSMTTT